MRSQLAAILLFLVSMTAMSQEVNFKADISEMSPMSYPPRSGLTDFSFEMRNDSAFVHLPYMGEVYTPAFSNDGLLRACSPELLLKIKEGEEL